MKIVLRFARHSECVLALFGQKFFLFNFDGLYTFKFPFSLIHYCGRFFPRTTKRNDGFQSLSWLWLRQIGFFWVASFFIPSFEFRCSSSVHLCCACIINYCSFKWRDTFGCLKCILLTMSYDWPITNMFHVIVRNFTLLPIILIAIIFVNLPLQTAKRFFLKTDLYVYN